MYSRFHSSYMSDINVVGRENQSNEGTATFGLQPNSGAVNFVFGENDNFKNDYVGSINPKEWKNIPIPVVEAFERILMEFDALNHKLNKQFDGLKRYSKRMEFQTSKTNESLKIREDQMYQNFSQ